MKNDRRHATRPYYKKSDACEYILTWTFTFITGSILGAVITLAVMP